MPEESRDGVTLTHLDEPLFDGAGATKRDLVAYVEQMADRMATHLRDRPLSVIRVRAGQPAFMQKNLPTYAPDWVASVSVWAERTKRDVTYALANDRRTLVWFANQRAVEYHPGLMTTTDPLHQTHLVLDLDPPSDLAPAEGFRMAVAATHLVKQALDELGLAGAAKTSGAKGMHVFVPLAPADTPDVAAATRAIAVRAARLDPALATTAFVIQDREGRVFVDSTRAGGGTVIAAYSPRVRPGAPVSFPVRWEDLDAVSPQDFTIHTVPGLLSSPGSTEGRDEWADLMPERQALPPDLVAEGHEIPIARVAAMHEGKRRVRERRRP
ncbi:MAG: ATP-dependent DNA ligase [Lapillicoccus sp.]